MRADLYLTQNGYTASRTKAQRLIAAGLLRIDGEVVSKAGQEIDPAIEHHVELQEEFLYVGRGGCKLEAALDAFALDVVGAWALDIGASTGGFTDCLLRRGAAKVYAVDAGVGQLASELLADVRVINREKCNARYLSPEALDADFVAHGGADVIVMDVSFISQTYIHPVFSDLLARDGRAITLIKPQFEVGREHLGKHGVVREAKWRRAAVERVLSSACAVGLSPISLIRSPIEGGDGNIEFLALFEMASTEAGCIEKLMASLPPRFFDNER